MATDLFEALKCPVCGCAYKPEEQGESLLLVCTNPACPSYAPTPVQAPAVKSS